MSNYGSMQAAGVARASQLTRRFATGLVLAKAAGCGGVPGPKTDLISPPSGPVDTDIGAGQTSKVDKSRCAGAFAKPRTSGDTGVGASPTSGN